MVAELGLHRHGPGRAAAAQPRPRPRQFARLAELERRTANSARPATRPPASAADARRRRAGTPRAGEGRARLSETLEPALPDHLDEQAERLMHRLCDAGLTVATAESCTGGMLAALLTDIEGAGHGFDRGFVTYTKHVEDRPARHRAATCSTRMTPFRKSSRARWPKARSIGPRPTSPLGGHRLRRSRRSRPARKAWSTSRSPGAAADRAPRRAFRSDRPRRRPGEIA